ncbi:MAG: 50S ribosomal protein L11 methyltransferase [Bdellovibrionales bacterium]|nr:50S ribosomal protein L11 methyltransferase [Bdellovibrionales bacterium]
MIYALQFSLLQEIPLKNGQARTRGEATHHNRTDALARFNDYCQDLIDPTSGDTEFYGVTEGVLLAEEAHERGYETESWVLDAGEAPHERDWVGQEHNLTMTAYFKTEESAEKARAWLKREYALEHEPVLETQEEQDWNATWRAAFQGIDVSDRLRILPPWHDDWAKYHDHGSAKGEPGSSTSMAFAHGIVAINPGAGFGTGTHETTQMCLQILDQCGSANVAAPAGALAGKTVLDFGSGSGILGITAALLGARVYCVEVDRLANENAMENAKLNGVQDRIHILERIPDELKSGKVDVLLANILRPILLQFAREIKACLKPQAELILSGLIESDLDQVIRAYQDGPENFKINRYEKNEWRALWLRK